MRYLDPSKPQRLGEFLYRRHGSLIFRRPLPRELQRETGMREVMRVLATSDLDEALDARDDLVRTLDYSWAFCSRALRDTERGLDTEASRELAEYGARALVQEAIDAAFEEAVEMYTERQERIARAAQTVPPQDQPQQQPGSHEPDAIALLQQVLSTLGHAAKPQAPKPAPAPTVAAAVRDYVAAHFDGWSVSTRLRRKRAFDAFVADLGAERSVAAVTPRDMEQWRTQLKGRGLGPGSIKNYLATAAALFQWAVGMEFCVKNPAQIVKRTHVRQRGDDEATRDAFTDAEVRQLFDASLAADRGGVNPEGRVARSLGPVLVLLQGLRPNEVGYLRPGDVRDVEGRLCIVVEPYTTSAHPKGAYRPRTKSSVRTVPVHPLLVPVLRRLAELRKDEPFLFDGVNSNVASERRNWLHSFAQRVRDLKSKTGRPIAAYSARHWFRTKLTLKHVPAEVADALMGHAHKGIGLRVYNHAMPLERLAAAVDSIDASAVEPLVRCIEGFVERPIRTLRPRGRSIVVIG